MLFYNKSGGTMINKKRLKAIYWNKFSLAGFMALPCLFFVIIFTSPSPWSSVLTAFLFFIIILTLPLTHFGEDTYQTYLVCKEKFKNCNTGNNYRGFSSSYHRISINRYSNNYFYLFKCTLLTGNRRECSIFYNVYYCDCGFLHTDVDSKINILITNKKLCNATFF